MNRSNKLHVTLSVPSSFKIMHLLWQVRYQVTPEGVQQIFAEKPHVHRAFMANVPAHMEENTFWTRFFKNELNRQVGLLLM